MRRAFRAARPHIVRRCRFSSGLAALLGQRVPSLVGPNAYLTVAKVWDAFVGRTRRLPTAGECLSLRRPARKVIYHCKPSDSAHDALEIMLDHSIHCVIVAKADDEILAGDGSREGLEDARKAIHASTSASISDAAKGSDSQEGAAEAQSPRLFPPIASDASLDVRGIFTETDFLRLVARPALDARRTRVEDVMTPVHRIAYATEDNDVSSCLQAMAALDCHHLPVLSREGDSLLGVLYIGELVGLTREHMEEAVSAWELGQGVGRALGKAVDRLTTGGGGQEAAQGVGTRAGQPSSAGGDAGDGSKQEGAKQERWHGGIETESRHGRQEGHRARQ